MLANTINVISYISHHYLIVLLIGYVVLELTRNFLFHSSEDEILGASKVKMIVVYGALVSTCILIIFSCADAESNVRKALIFGLGIYMMGHLFAYTKNGIIRIRQS